MDFVEEGDWVTLFLIKEKQLLEILIGENFSPSLERLCIGKGVDDIIVYDTEYKIQYVKKGRAKQQKIINSFSEDTIIQESCSEINIAEEVTIDKENVEKSEVERESFIEGKVEKEIEERINKLLQQVKNLKREEKSRMGNNDVHQRDGKNIYIQDFMVRTSTFKCLNNNHKLQNIDANVGVIDKKGNVQRIKISAGYCPNCGVFFIMESIFQSLKEKGIPICRITNKKNYNTSDEFVNGMRLAKESILMQYGYLVSKSEGLSEARRRKILALLVDNKILTRSDIISYLDFFINQRKTQSRYEKVIEKWEKDREFIAEYRTGDYMQYGVGSIYRR